MRLVDSSVHDLGTHQPHLSQSVSWNSTGSWLVFGGPDPKILSVEDFNNNLRGSDVVTVAGHHTAPTDRVRFHPSDPSCLCTSAMDSTVRVFDIRSGKDRPMGIIDVSVGKSAVSIDWCPSASSTGPSSSSSYLAVTERGGSIKIYDTRKLNRTGGGTPGGGRQQQSNHTKSTPVHTFQIPNVDVDTCIFSPLGNHIVAATAPRGGMMSDLRIWNWKDGQEAFDKSVTNNTQFKVPAHSGPIFSLQFSPDGKHLATGSSDAIVGIWDVATMCCTTTITRRLKFISGVAFSPDSRWLASSSEEDGVDIASTSTGESIGTAHLRERPRDGGPVGGADEVAFNPKHGQLLACARGPVPQMPISALSPVVVLKLRLGV